MDLFDKRFSVCENILKFCSIAGAYASLKARDDNREHIVEGLKAAEESFRGIGYFKMKLLFGSDIHQLCDRLNKAYSFFVAQGGSPPSNPEQRTHWIEEDQKQLLFVYDTASNLSTHFKEYLYMGDYKIDA